MFFVIQKEDGRNYNWKYKLCCLGLYNVNRDGNLLYAYRDGWEYVLNHNTAQTVFSNFETD